ncbi:hypothetical protein Y1Q_0011115 [Alligator mississippiensis]|uniref:Uncharacterized protein n=2 Tax=Alligator mississippiensis TaxID=8496 RepID=A0A151PJK1_ALLMI|nr:hypothetical protein Y1Q_0011115 [Alligator mississippiensis]
MDRGKMLQEKQREVRWLEKKLEAAEKAKQTADERFERRAAVVDSGLRVQELQRRLEGSEQAYNELRMQSEAYKKHSMDLLTKEKKLNTKLRMILTPPFLTQFSAGISTTPAFVFFCDRT